MADVDTAEKEASEVLHSLLSVERIEKQEENGENQSPSSHSFQSNPATGSDGQEGESQIQWHTPVSISHSLFSAIDPNNHFSQTMDDQQVIWEGHAIVDPDANINTIYTGHPVVESEGGEESPKRQNPPNGKSKASTKGAKKKVPVKKKKKPNESNPSDDPTKLEESAAQVKDRLKEVVTELTKGEHDMYLMGVTMACLANPDTTVRHKERRRLRAQYVYQGRRVCLDAFLYLENCTHYQLKRIRKHVMTNGVAPRVHGNHGKKPHNTFSLDIYRHATEFLKQYLEQHTGERDIVNTKKPIQLPWDVTRKNLHDAYKEYGQILEPGIKLMGYSTFRHFMKEQFPHVQFCKIEPKACTQQHQPTQQQQQIQQQNQQIQTVERVRDQVPQQVQKCVINNEVQQVIPLVVAPPNDNTTQHHQQTFLVTPVPQLLPNGNIVTPQNPTNHAATNTFSYQLANTGYVINEQGNIVTTMANAQHHTPYAFGRM
ncbi:hypothetical protein NQ314_020671 [Rhamnusium bicolor]|uniref:Uncharacterized protein n=1 Tax=Rhamnusium bicolor TaxID=1586634 RepID=A0AAV8WKE9_9CUCU|nr:hypothetical protein NQ314_020671 [Rhamnusium bicolor]